MKKQCDMAIPQMYAYITDYNHSVWDRIISRKPFDDLINDFHETGICEDGAGQAVIDSYRLCEPEIPAMDGINGNALFHVLKNNDLALTDVSFRNFAKGIQRQADACFARSMAENRGMAFNMANISSIYKNFIPEPRTTLRITSDELEMRDQFMLLYQEKIAGFFDAVDEMTQKHKTKIYASDESQRDLSIIFKKLYSALCFREEFSISFFADMTIKKDADGGRYYHSNKDGGSSLQGILTALDVRQYPEAVEKWMKENPDKLDQIPFLFRIENLAPNKLTLKSFNKTKNYYTVNKNNRFAETDLLNRHMDELAKHISVIGTQDRHLRPRKGDGNKVDVSKIDYNYLGIILLEYFLHLGLPAGSLQRFMGAFGYSFGSVKPLCRNTSLYEPYIKYLIDSGISYRAISFIIESQSSICF